MVKPRSHRRPWPLLEGSVLASALLLGGAASAEEPAPPAAAKDAPAPKVEASAPAPKVEASAPAPKVEASPPAADKPRDPVMARASDERRSGLAINLSFGNGIASVVGYPNDPKKIGYARYYTASGVRPSGTFSLWVGGAITDWFNFGVGFNGGSLNFTGKTTAGAGGLIFHVETYPLFLRGGAFRDVGIMLDAGTGSASIIDDISKEKIVDGANGSSIGGGIFYEAAKLWRIRLAPFMYANYVWSDTVRRPGLFFGIHSTFYWKPSAK